MQIILCTSFFLVVIVVGFDESAYTVDEGEDLVVCLALFSGEIAEGARAVVLYKTLGGTASVGKIFIHLIIIVIPIIILLYNYWSI